ncbi:MAG: molybdate ABC transporter permease subunit [Spirochaetaceae bacterium]|jgi:molybdate transport system permease protein|nr:molybdate ABC transporter permease subunit [Spirochaetaceae bacterium]
MDPVFISIKTASAAGVITFFLGLSAARLVADMRRGPLKTAVDGLFTLPLVLPPTVAGFFLLALLGARRPLGRFLAEYLGVKIAFSWAAAVIAAVTASFPLMYRAARGALEQGDPALVQAARTLGMGEWKIFWRVRLPSSLPGIASGAVLAFARGLGEFGATAMIAGNIQGKTRTMPLAVYSAVASGDMDGAARYVLGLTVFSFIAAALMNALGGGPGKGGKR